MADISKISIPNGNGTSTYDIKDSNAVHTVTPQTGNIGSASLASDITVVNGTTHTTLGANALTNTSGSTTDFKLSLSNVVVNSTHSTTSVPNVSVSSATVVTGITAS